MPLCVVLLSYSQFKMGVKLSCLSPSRKSQVTGKVEALFVLAEPWFSPLLRGHIQLLDVTQSCYSPP